MNADNNAVTDLYTSRNVVVKLYTVPGGFVVGAGHIVTHAVATERLSDITDLMEASARVESSVRASAL